MKRFIPIIVIVLLLFSACNSIVEQSNNQQLSPTQSQHIFRNVDLGMTMDEVKIAEEKNGCIFIDNTDSSMTRENAETIVESAKKDNISVLIDNGDSYAVANADFNDYRGTVSYEFYDDKLAVIYFMFDNGAKDIYDDVKKLKFNSKKSNEETNVSFPNDEIGDRSTWKLDNNIIIQVMFKYENDNVVLVFNGLNTSLFNYSES